MPTTAMMLSGGSTAAAPSGATKWWWYKQATSWFKDTGTTAATANGDPIKQWNDNSGNGRNAVRNDSDTLVLDTGTTYLGNPTLKADSTTGSGFHYLRTPDMTGAFSGSTGAELFVVIKAKSDSPATIRAGFMLDAEGTAGTYYPSTDGHIKESFAGSGQYDITPGVSLSSQFRVYNVAAKTSFYQVAIDGSVVFSNATHTFTLNRIAPDLCADGSPKTWDGWVAEWILYHGVLNTTERAATLAYLQTGSGSPL